MVRDRGRRGDRVSRTSWRRALASSHARLYQGAGRGVGAPLSAPSPSLLRASVDPHTLTIAMHDVRAADGKDDDVFRWDDRSPGVYNSKDVLHQASYALSLLLPYPITCTSYVERLFLYLRNITTDALPFLSLLTQGRAVDFPFHAHVTGSKGENLALPLTFSFDDNLDFNFINKADLDLLFEIPEEYFNIQDRVLQTEGVHPGYFRYSGVETAFAMGLAQAVSNFPQLMGQMHGPSVMANTPLKAVDHVVAFKFFGWPEAAREFTYRQRPSGWPSNDVITDIVQGGCHMVLKPHNFTDTDVQNEWRLSFSFAEKKLAALLTKAQKMTYILFKLLQREYFQFPNEITSYHLKTALFWECERVSGEEWTHHNVARRLLSMTEWLHNCLNEHNLPSYFIPTNNLIDHVPQDRIQQIKTTVGKVKDNLFEYLLEYFRKNRIMGCPFSVATEDYQSIVDQLLNPVHRRSDAEMEELRTNTAIQCACWQVADFYLSEKVIRDATQFSFIPDEGAHAKYLIQFYLQNHMVPLRAASFVLHEAWPEEDHELSSPEASELFHCLANIDAHLSPHVTGTAEGSGEADRVIDLFTQNELHAIKVTVQQLQKILDAEGDSEICLQSSDNKTRLQATWHVLTHLVAYCFIVLNSKDRGIKEQYLHRIQQLRHKLAMIKGHEDLYRCSQQLEAFSLLQMDRYADVEAVLASAVLKPRAGVFLTKMMALRKTKMASDQACQQWCWDRISIGRFEPKAKDPSVFTEWCRLNSTHGNCPGLRGELPRLAPGDDGPVGRLFETHDRSFQDSCLMRWEEDVTHNMLVPADNLLRPGLQAMMDRILAPSETTTGAETASIHPGCKLAVAKNLVMLGSTDKAIALLEDIVDAKCFNEFYRVFPLECRLMLDDRVLSGKPLLIQDHFDFSITIYALFLLVKCHVQQGEHQLAIEKTEEMTRLCVRMLNDPAGHSYPWKVQANNLTLLGTAQNICRNKTSSLAAFAFVALLMETKGPLKTEVTFEDLQTGDRPFLQTVHRCINLLAGTEDAPGPLEALRTLLDVLYPEADLVTALDRLAQYCSDDVDSADGHQTFTEALRSLICLQHAESYRHHTEAWTSVDDRQNTRCQ